MKDALKNAGLTVLGLGLLLLLLALPVLFIKGGLWAAQHILPVLSTIGGVLLGVDLLVLLPLSLVGRARPFTGGAILFSSYVFGATLWLAGLIFTYTLWGFLAVFVGLFLMGIGVVPIAMLATAVHGMWSPFWDLVIMTLCTFGARIIGVLIVSAAPTESSVGQVEAA